MNANNDNNNKGGIRLSKKKLMQYGNFLFSLWLIFEGLNNLLNSKETALELNNKLLSMNADAYSIGWKSLAPLSY